MDKKLNKNLAIRAAGALFIATMYTTSLVCGNYARYATTGKANDSARSTSFGVFVTASGDLFGETYYEANQTNGNEPAGKSDGNSPAGAGISVKSMAQYGVDGVDNVVAPGTQNSEGMTISVTGVPEVDVKIEYSMPFTEDIYLRTPYDSNGNVGDGTYPDFTDSAATKGFTFNGIYYPLEFTLTGKVLESSSIKTLSVTGSGDKACVTGSLTEITEVVKELNNNSGITYKAGTVLDTEVGDLTLTWEWKNTETGPTTNRIKDFYTTKATTKDIITDYGDTNLIDKMDTLLGDFATWSYDNNKGYVTVEDIISTKCGFITAMETFNGNQSIAARAKDSELIFRGLFGYSAASVYEPLGWWLNRQAADFDGSIYRFQQDLWNGAHTDRIYDNSTPKNRVEYDYYDTYVKGTIMPADPDPTNARYWLQVSVNLSVTVTQVD